MPYWSVEKAAIREVLEEVGILLDLHQLCYFCSLTLPNGRVVISLYAELEDWQADHADKLVFLSREQIEEHNDFAPGMKQEAILLYEKCGI